MKFGHNGMSLIEAMIGLAIASGIGLVLMRQQDTAGKIQTKANINQAMNSVASVVQTSLANRAVCTLSLQGKGVNDDVPALVDGKVNPLFPAAGQPEYMIDTPISHVSVNQESNGIKVLSMKIVEEQGKDFLSVVYDVDPQKVKKKFGADTIGKKYLLHGTKDDDGKYLFCHSEQTNILNSAIITACTSMGANWNPTTLKCELSNLPLCMLTSETCRGRYSVNRGSRVLVTDTKKCSQQYKRDGFPACLLAGGKYLYRPCDCGGTSYPVCNCDTGKVGCYIRTTMTCSVVTPGLSANNCCQPTAPAAPQPNPSNNNGGGGGGGCFVAGTQVTMADGSLKNIEDVAIGEQLKDGKGKNVTVQSLKRYPTNNAKFSINGGAYFFTANHPFLTTDGWKSLDPAASEEESPGLAVSKMKAGDILIRESGVEVILVLDSIQTEETVYNFTLDDSHEYIADGYVVHNKANADDTNNTNNQQQQ